MPVRTTRRTAFAAPALLGAVVVALIPREPASAPSDDRAVSPV